MYALLDEGQHWQESYYPEVKIFKDKKRIEVTLFLTPALHERFQVFRKEYWTYIWEERQEWIAYPFSYFLQGEQFDTVEVQSLNTLLHFCSLMGTEAERTENPEKSQLAFVHGENPQEFGMGAYGLWAHFSSLVTRAISKLDTFELHAFEEYTESRMKGAHKIIAPEGRLSRSDNRMHFYRGGNTLPIFTTFGNCACLSATSNSLDYDGGFQLSPHNIDSYSQQFLLMIGTLVFWARIRAHIRLPVSFLLSSPLA